MVRTLILGEVVQGEITAPGAQTLVEFEAIEGQEIFIDFESISGGRVTYELFAPSGIRVESDFSFTGDSGDQRAVLAESGLYRLEITGSGDDTPSFEVGISEIPEPAIRTVTLGDVIDEAIVSPGAQTFINFEATEGQELSLIHI